jgi:REP element-mobilizing transposase RayT
VHLLVCLPTTHSIADLIKKLKGSSAHLVTHQLAAGQFFKWQAGYGAVSVSPRHLTQVTNYIERQREHHARGTLIAALEDLGQPPPQ